jgi:predicted nuclease of predicted toxin-antitoxin system
MILADHCVYEATVRIVRAAGYPIQPLRAIGAIDSSDPEVLSLAVEKDWILLTNDVDFGDILRYPPQTHCGVILLRIRPQFEDEVHAVLLRVLAECERESLRRRLVVVDRRKYRIRIPS